MISTDKQVIDWFLNHAVENVFPSRDVLRERLMKGERLRVYYGIDPTGPSIHLGHTVPLRKMSELQNMGHEIVILVGDITAMIGDPTDKSAVRKQLTKEEVMQNLKAYREQIGRIISFEGENAAQWRFNSEWFGKMGFADVLELTSHFTVQQMLERDMFEKRIKEGKPIHVHEFLYPVMQGYDSVALDVDIEIGGNDQTFNMLAGRDLMKTLKNKEKFVVTSKLLADPTGKKMGKSEGNMIAFSDSSIDAYGKLMSWPDEMILPAFEVLTDMTKKEIEDRRASIVAGENPMKFKRELAQRVVAWMFGEQAGQEAADHFTHVHQQHEKPEDISEVVVEMRELPLIEALVAGGLVGSKSDARRQIEQGGVKVDDQVITDVKAFVTITEQGIVLQKGKRHFVKFLYKG